MPIATMSVARVRTASIVLDQGNILWVTGGHVLTSDIMNPHYVTETTDYVGLNGSWPGPNLSQAVHSHCLVKVNSSTVFLIGGLTTDYLLGAEMSIGDVLSFPWAYDLQSGNWASKALPQYVP